MEILSQPGIASPHQRLSLIKKHDLFMYFHVNSNLKTSASEIYHFGLQDSYEKGLALKQKYRASASQQERRGWYQRLALAVAELPEKP